VPGDETVSVAPGHAPTLPEPTSFPREFGGYRLLGLLGAGGMGTVYEAEQLATGRRLALKMLGQQLDSPEMRQRFLREGRLAARVNHPNSLYVFGSEEIEGLPVITMEIAGSGTLKDTLKERGPLPVEEAVDATLDVIAGLESALANGVLHRDIKPSNCFVSPDGSVKVGDFGLSVSTLAKSDTFVTAHGKIMGTPAFASPEQLRGDTLDLRADIYSVGATLFTLLTDRAPFEGENAVQVVANAVNQDPPRLSGVRKDVPSGLERVVTRCLAKEPEKRYADYTALRDALLPFSSKEPEPASILVRLAAGWIDFLLAFLPPYVALMFLVGGE
jgi:serine/threonine protein kinase